jgi:hypothetical protein
MLGHGVQGWRYTAVEATLPIQTFWALEDEILATGPVLDNTMLIAQVSELREAVALGASAIAKLKEPV